MRINNKLMKAKYITETNTNLNDYTTDGIYFFNGDYTPTNIPAGVNGWLQVLSIGDADNSDLFTKQIWYRAGTAGSNDYETFVRTRSWGGDWGAWQRLLTTKDFSTTQFQSFDGNTTDYTITIPHNGGSNIKSALVICSEGVWLVTVGNSNQVWELKLGGTSTKTMTASIAEHTATYVKAKLTFNSTIYGGIQAIVPYFK